MKQNEIDEFIEQMEKIGDVWTREQVEDTYGDRSLEEALSCRKNEVNIFFDIVGKIINR